VHPILGVLIGYLAGSIPFAYLAGRAKGIDLRQHGSGNLGATNAMRVLGTTVGLTV
jgi:glycerol-3-phosphate acyltransferase PlsY